VDQPPLSEMAEGLSDVSVRQLGESAGMTLMVVHRRMRWLRKGLGSYWSHCWMVGSTSQRKDRHSMIHKEANIAVSPEQVEEEEPEMGSTTRKGGLARLPARFRE